MPALVFSRGCSLGLLLRKTDVFSAIIGRVAVFSGTHQDAIFRWLADSSTFWFSG